MTGSRRSRTRPAIGVRVAAGLHLLLGAGFAASVPFVLAHLRRSGELPASPFGWRCLAGPFEQLGTERLAILGWALVVVSAIDVLARIWLWQGRRQGRWLGLATDGPALILGIGFGLPLLVVGVPIRAALVLANRTVLYQEPRVRHR